MKALLTLAALSAFLLASPAAAQSSYMTYQFTGNCEDCNPANTPAIATLVLKDYHPGDDLSNDNLVSFTYHSNLVSWNTQDFQPSDVYELGLAGSLGTATGPYQFYFHELTLVNGLTFTTVQADSTFNYDFIPFEGVPCGVDHGTGTWSLMGGPAVPEAATWSMMIAGFGMVGASLRRRGGRRFLAG